MSDVVRKASFGVGQHGVRACSPGQVEDCLGNECGKWHPLASGDTKASAMDQGMEQ